MAKGSGGVQEGNYIKLYRNILDWEWWHDINPFRLFIFLLLKANWKEGSWKGITVKRGTYITSLKKLSEDTDLSVDELRTAIKKLEKTQEITKQTTNKYTVFTVVNYDLYQVDTKQNTKQIPNDSQPIPKLFPTIEERKESKEGNKDTMCSEANALFEKVWQLYPVKRGKGQVSASAKKRLYKIGYEEITRAIGRYTEYVDSIDYLQYQNGSTFFNSGYIDYLDANYVPGQATVHKKKGNDFNNGEQRKYNFDSLERELSSN